MESVAHSSVGAPPSTGSHVKGARSRAHAAAILVGVASGVLLVGTALALGRFGADASRAGRPTGAQLPTDPHPPLARRPPDAEATGASPCYVALLHGSGPDLTAEMHEGSALMERYWNPAQDPAFALARQAQRADLVAAHCTFLRVGFDGGSPWWSEKAAGAAARALQEFIVSEQIPDGRLLLVGHSMGGLVARYIVNNGDEDAPYFNEYAGRDARMDYGLVHRKTGAILTVATPHTGSEAADAFRGKADHGWSNAGAALLRFLGVVRDSAAMESLSRATMEAAGAPGGDMADEGRTIPIFTVAATTVDPTPGAQRITRADRRLGLAWGLICGRPSVLNLWGVGCGRGLDPTTALAGDGVVSRASAHGDWTRGPLDRPPLGGVWRPYRDVAVNHSQSRYLAQSWDLIAGVLTEMATPAAPPAYAPHALAAP